MPKPKRNAEGRLGLESLVGKTIRAVVIRPKRFVKIAFLDKKGKVLFTCQPWDLADAEGMFFHQDNLEIGE